MAGLVIARQRPGTAKGTMFLLFEDEFGTVNLIVPSAVYERHRQLARAEPLLLARGRLERSAEPSNVIRWDRPREAQAEEVRPVISVLVRELAPLEQFLPDAAQDLQASGTVHRLSPAGAGSGEELGAQEVGSSMRAAAPPVQSFAMGRRR